MAIGLTTPFTWSPQRAYHPSAYTQRQEGPDQYKIHQHSSQDYAGGARSGMYSCAAIAQHALSPNRQQRLRNACNAALEHGLAVA